MGLLVAGTAHANTITGSIYENVAAASMDATPANVPGGTPNVTFTTTSPINFSTSNYTIGGFINSGGGTTTVLTGSNQLGNTLDNTLFNFTGSVTVTNGETFTVGHDDGLTLVIDGMTVISQPGPTSFKLTTDTYTGPSGTYAFQLVYGENTGAPADLSISLPLTTSVTPEPSSMVLLGSGLLGLGTMLRRRASQQV